MITVPSRSAPRAFSCQVTVISELLHSSHPSQNISKFLTFELRALFHFTELCNLFCSTQSLSFFLYLCLQDTKDRPQAWNMPAKKALQGSFQSRFRFANEHPKKSEIKVNAVDFSLETSERPFAEQASTQTHAEHANKPPCQRASEKMAVWKCVSTVDRTYR